MANENWIIRPYRKDDEEKILSLFAIEYSQQSFRTKQWWDWRHVNNPAGPAIIWVVESDNEIIAHFCFVPVKIKLYHDNV